MSTPAACDYKMAAGVLETEFPITFDTPLYPCVQKWRNIIKPKPKFINSDASYGGAPVVHQDGAYKISIALTEHGDDKVLVQGHKLGHKRLQVDDSLRSASQGVLVASYTNTAQTLRPIRSMHRGYILTTDQSDSHHVPHARLSSDSLTALWYSNTIKSSDSLKTLTSFYGSSCPNNGKVNTPLVFIRSIIARRWHDKAPLAFPLRPATPAATSYTTSAVTSVLCSALVSDSAELSAHHCGRK
eukprot:1193419-Prorocentrum_minimum.AAC.3